MASRVDRARRRRHGQATYRLVGYADDFVVMIAGSRAHAEHLKVDVARVLAPVGLRLSEEKTTIVHIDEAFEILGFRIQRQTRRGSRKLVRLHLAIEEVLDFDHDQSEDDHQAGTNHPRFELLRLLDPVLRGWTN